MQQQIENMLNGQATPEEAAAEMASQINSSIEEYNLVKRVKSVITELIPNAPQVLRGISRFLKKTLSIFGKKKYNLCKAYKT